LEVKNKMPQQIDQILTPEEERIYREAAKLGLPSDVIESHILKLRGGTIETPQMTPRSVIDEKVNQIGFSPVTVPPPQTTQQREDIKNLPEYVSPRVAAQKSVFAEPSTLDTINDLVRGMMSGGGGMIGGRIGGALGSVLGPAGTIGGSIIGGGVGSVGTNYLMQRGKSVPGTGATSGLTDMEPGSPQSDLTNAIEEEALGRLMGFGMTSLGKAIKVTRGAPITPGAENKIFKFGPSVSQALRMREGGTTPSFGPRALRVSSRWIEDLFGPGTKDRTRREAVQLLELGAKDLGYKLGHNFTQQELDDPNLMLQIITNSLSATQLNKFPSTIGMLDSYIKDPRKLQAMLNKGGRFNQNLKSDLAAYRFMRVWNQAQTLGPQGRPMVTQDGLMKVFFDRDFASSNKKLYSQRQLKDIEDFFRNASTSQDQRKGPGKLLQFVSAGVAGGVVSIPALANLVSNHPIATGIGTTLQLSLGALGKLLAKPETARILIEMAGDKPLGVPTSMALRTLARGMNGFTVAIANAQGQKVNGVMRDGKFIPSDSVFDRPIE
jgi:hypothetical protein